MDAVNGPPALGSIKFLTGPLAGRSYSINKPVTTIGREPTNDIAIPDPTVSRQHAQITWTNGTWTIAKLVAQNTLSINQHDVQQTAMNTGDTIGVGATTTFTFLSSVEGQR